jgi:hypothetical protein
MERAFSLPPLSHGNTNRVTSTETSPEVGRVCSAATAIGAGSGPVHPIVQLPPVTGCEIADPEILSLMMQLASLNAKGSIYQEVTGHLTELTKRIEQECSSYFTRAHQMLQMRALPPQMHDKQGISKASLDLDGHCQNLRDLKYALDELKKKITERIVYYQESEDQNAKLRLGKYEAVLCQVQCLRCLIELTVRDQLVENVFLELMKQSWLPLNRDNLERVHSLLNHLTLFCVNVEQLHLKEGCVLPVNPLLYVALGQRVHYFNQCLSLFYQQAFQAMIPFADALRPVNHWVQTLTPESSMGNVISARIKEITFLLGLQLRAICYQKQIGIDAKDQVSGAKYTLQSIVFLARILKAKIEKLPKEHQNHIFYLSQHAQLIDRMSPDWQSGDAEVDALFQQILSDLHTQLNHLTS